MKILFDVKSYLSDKKLYVYKYSSIPVRTGLAINASGQMPNGLPCKNKNLAIS